MNENGGKGNTVLLTVIGIATLLVVVVGATFAYFAAVVTGNETASTMKITAAETGTAITLTGVNDPINVTGIYPREEAWVVRDLTLTKPADVGSTTVGTYTFSITNLTNNYAANDLKYTFVNKSKSTNVTLVSQTNNQTPLAAGNIATGEYTYGDETSVVYTLSLYFVNDETNNQNTAANVANPMSASFTVTCAVAAKTA